MCLKCMFSAAPLQPSEKWDVTATPISFEGIDAIDPTFASFFGILNPDKVLNYNCTCTILVLYWYCIHIKTSQYSFLYIIAHVFYDVLLR